MQLSRKLIGRSGKLDVMRFSPMPLAAAREPFDDPDWIFEPKWDGFRALAYIDGHS